MYTQKKCELTIFITFEEYNKIKKILIMQIIQITINSNQKEHCCNCKYTTEYVDVEEIKTREEEKEMAIILIKANLMEPPSFHINNLYNNKIKWGREKTENLVYRLQEEKYANNNNLFIKTDKILKKNGNYSIKYIVFLEETQIKKRRRFYRKKVKALKKRKI